MAADGEQRATLIDRQSYRSPADRPPVERPIRLAVIGLGPRGRGNVVGKALAYAEYELAAVCDRSEAVAGDFCGYEQFVPGFGDDAERDAWYRGMFAAPYHVDGSTQVFCAATDRIRRLLRRNEPGAEVLSPEAWAERFYPGEVP